MSVKLAAAHIDERGKATGGKAGDQTGKEVCVRNYYVHSKGWRVFRPKDAAKAEKIAQDAQYACENKFIGYDQNQRTSLYTISKPYGFNCAKVTTPCETDCSALVRVCCAYAGIDLPDFNTSNEAKTLLNSGAFTELTGDKYTKSGDYLRRGDILVTKTKGHTEIVISNGSKAGNAPTTAPTTDTTAPTTGTTPTLGSRVLKNGMSGADVKELQADLIKLGYDLGKWGADGDFGDQTEMVVRRFQTQEGLAPDGEFGPLSLAALNKALERLSENTGGDHVQICGGNCYVRAEPNTSGDIRGIAHEGDKLPYGGTMTDDGWLNVVYKDRLGWVSGKYGRLVK